MGPALYRIVLAFTLALALAAGARAQPPEYVPGEIVVGYAETATPAEIAELEAAHGLTLLTDLSFIRARHYRLPAGVAVEDTALALQRFPIVRYAEPNYLHKRQALPTDPRFGEQWYLRNTGQVVNGIQGTTGEDINWASAMNVFTGTREVIVAVVDSGVALDHPELTARLWTHPVEVTTGFNDIDEDGNGLTDDVVGWDFFDFDRLPFDENGHGTLVGSLIGGQTNNGQGGAGVSPTARIMVLRVGNDLGSISTTASVNAFLYAGRRGARIVNYSAGGPAFSSAMLAAIQWLNSKGVLLAVASGNGGDDHVGDNNDVTPTYPASYPVANIVSVAATDQAGALARFSNFGASSVHIAAPGTNMLGADIHRSLHYLENFEGSLAGWTQGHNPGSLSSLNWSVFLDAFGNTWLTDSQSIFGSDVPYQPFTDSWAASPAINLAGIVGPLLVYRVWHSLELNFDFLVVEVSANGGLSWTPIDAVTGSSFDTCPGCAVPAGSLRMADVSAFEDQAIHVRFRLITDGSFNFFGAFIDNVAILKVDVFQYDGTQYQFLQGTSFSAPLVAGAAALLWSQRPDLTLSQVRQTLLGSARADARLSAKVSTGGKLDVNAALQGAIATPPGLTVSADFVDFQKQGVGFASTPRPVTVTNSGAGNISISGIASSSPGTFPVTTTCVPTLAPGVSCTISPQFSPSATGETDAVVQIASSAPGSPHVINLLGVGAAPDQVPDAFSFPTVGDAAPGTPVTSGPVTVSGLNAPAAVSITGGEYSINGAAFTSAPGTVNNGDSVTVRVGSSGSSGGTASATLTIGGVSGTFSVTTVVFPPKTLTVSVLGSGSISSNPAGINCGTDCSESYSHGTTVTLSPTALPDHRFTGWGGACTGAGVCEITMDAPKNVTATFSPLAQRSFVAPFGADTNPCSLAAPCRTLAAALVQTRTGGEIVVLESAGYGPVTIGKSVTITAPKGIYAGISVFPGQNGITIDGDGIRVAIRGIAINGQGGGNGILVNRAQDVLIDRCVVANMGEDVGPLPNFNDSGIRIVAPNARVVIKDSAVRGSRGTGVFVNVNASLSVLRGRIEKNAGGGIAVQLTSAADLSVTDSFISQNGAGGIGLGGAPGSGNLSAGISRNVITDNSGSGIIAHSAIPTSMVKTISITDNVIQNNSAGYGGISIFAMPGETVTAAVTNNVVVNNAPNGILAAGPGATVIADANVVSRSGSGLALQESAVMKSPGNNAVENNGTDVSGSLTALAPR